MFVDTVQLSDSSKVYIYPSNRKFYPEEVKAIKEKINQFCTSWAASKQNNTSCLLKYDRFLIFFIDAVEHPVKAEDIDELVNFIQQLEKDYKIVLLDRINVCFKQGKYVQYKDLYDFKKLIKNKSVSEKTIVFNNLINTKEEFDNYWEVPLSDTWLDRFL